MDDESSNHKFRKINFKYIRWFVVGIKFRLYELKEINLNDIFTVIIFNGKIQQQFKKCKVLKNNDRSVHSSYSFFFSDRHLICRTLCSTTGWMTFQFYFVLCTTC